MTAFSRLLSGFLCVAAAGAIGCGGDTTVLPGNQLEVGSITINGATVSGLERGYHTTLTATVRDKSGAVVPIPIVWRSANENVATIDANGRVTAVDTGNATIYATSLGVNSAPIGIRVLQSLGKIAVSNFTPPSANSPGATPDSIRVVVTTPAATGATGVPVAGARVAFAVTGGGGTISPAIAVTNSQGVAAAQWKLGTAAGVNTATATLLGEEDKPYTYAVPAVATFSLRSFDALQSVLGNNQTGQILSNLPVEPSVKVVDSTGKIRAGVPVTFQATKGGRVAFAIVATGADGVASPGAWTLGDIPGEQNLLVKIENATFTLRATGTGTPVHYVPVTAVAGSNVTCAINTDKTASCFGEEPKVGDSSAVNKSVPTPTKNGFTFTSIAASPSSIGHVCAIGTDQGVYCWGVNSLPDTATIPKAISSAVPVRTLTDIKFTQAAPGQQHNCALGTDQMVYCWGDGTAGQLGDRTIKQRFTPGVIFGGYKVTGVSSGSGHTCAVTVDAAAICWGLNASGQLGNGTTVSSSSPTSVIGGQAFQSVSAGESFTCGLTTLGRAYCWGTLLTGAQPTTTPKTYADAPAFTSIASGGFHTCGLTADGSAYCWGNNNVGQLGDSTLVERANPTAVVTNLKFKSIYTGYAHTCGQTLDGSLACWGRNQAGELGDTLVAFRAQPRYIVLSVTP